MIARLRKPAAWSAWWDNFWEHIFDRESHPNRSRYIAALSEWNAWDEPNYIVFETQEDMMAFLIRWS